MARPLNSANGGVDLERQKVNLLFNICESQKRRLTRYENSAGYRAWCFQPQKGPGQQSHWSHVHDRLAECLIGPTFNARPASCGLPAAVRSPFSKQELLAALRDVLGV